MRRRDFIVLVGSGVTEVALGARAQEAGKIWRMGFLAHGYETFYAELFTGLRELGHEEGRNLVVERRYAEGHAERFPDFAAEMVRLKVDVIIVVTTPAALAVKKATTVIPVVFPNAINPVETGVVATLAQQSSRELVAISCSLPFPSPSSTNRLAALPRPTPFSRLRSMAFHRRRKCPRSRRPRRCSKSRRRAAKGSLSERRINRKLF
jgi:ABC transporter substrate binding protein